MSRPPISYPIAGPSNYATPSRHTLEPSPMPTSDALPRRVSGNRGSHRTTDSRSNVTTLDSHITKLLIHTKQMLQGLDQWAQGALSEEGVSDIYVKLGNEFDTCKHAFRAVGISTSDLHSVPKDLRACLEDCLAETPSPDTLNVYLPNIRTIIFNLLSGLKQKQAAFKRIQTERALSGTPLPSLNEEQYTQSERRPAPRSVYSNHSDQSSDSISPAAHDTPLPPTRIPSSQALADRARSAIRPAPPDAFRPPRRTADAPRRSVSPQPGQRTLNASTSSTGETDGLVRHQLSDNPVPSPPITTAELDPPPPPPPKPIPHPDRFSRDSLGRPISRFSMDSEVTNGSPIRSLPSQSPSRTMETLSEDADSTPIFVPPPSLPTLNLPSATFGFGDEPPAVDILPDVPPETRATLAALGRSEALERRASKRFSSYTFNKIPSSPNHKKAVSSDSPQRPTRRADRPPPMPPLPESLAPASLGVTTSDRSKTPSPISGLVPPNGDEPDSGSSPRSNRTERSDSSSTGSVRVVKTPEPVDIASQSTPRPGAVSPPTLSPAAVSIFLQIGRQVKKVKVDLPVSLSSLRLLFMEKFEYDPGVNNFPDVYIRDHSTGVQFELEDTDDMREGSLLSLDIEPMEQIQRHVGQGFASMLDEMREMKKELKAALDQSKRLSMTPAPSLLAPSPSMTRPPPRAEATPSGSPSSIRVPRELAPAPIDTDITPVKIGTVHAERLQAHQDEVEALRRDLAVMRQVHVDFLTETKEAFTKLRHENNNMRELVKTKMGGSRAILDTSKTKLEALSAETIQAVEEISDVIESAREDASKRFVTPSKSQMARITADLKKAHELIDAFAAEVTAIEPTWRATWHRELSRVMEEQRLLPHHKKLAVDLKSDIEDVEVIFKNVSDFVGQRAANGGKAALRPAYRPPSPDETGGVRNLLMEIRTKESDPNQRLRAIEAQQKAREREKANQTDEFQDELSGFVAGRKLKKTGGTDEVERQRQRKQDQTLRKMLTGDGGSPTGMLSPQPTGASVRSQSSFTSGTGQGGSSGVRTASRSSARSEDVFVKEEIKVEREEIKVERE